MDVKFICMMTHYSQSNTCLHIQDEICYTKYNEKKGPFRTGIGFGEQDASFRLLCLASVLFFFVVGDLLHRREGAPIGFAQPNVSWDA